MNDFKTAYPDGLNLDPYKRVYYSHGLVLGVDEFVQEERYLLERQRLHNRGLHGYGTVCGLRLDTRDNDGQPEIVVGPGVAVDPQGREVRVPEGQCARLDDWLLRHHDEVVALLGSPPAGSPAQLALHLVLCHAECTTDEVPVPSGPCQSLDRGMVPSRIADDFRLELRADLSLPEQVEEQAVREFVALLDAIPVLDAPGGMSEQDMLELVRALAPGGSPGMVLSPVPAGHMHPDDAGELLRVAFRVWVTDVRPELLASARNCAGGPPTEDCVLLARVEFPVQDTEAGLRVSGTVQFDESERPYLLHTRLLQEYLRSCCAHAHAPPALGSPPSGMGSLIDESDLMHLTGDETVAGAKTFVDPMRLRAAGRVRRTISLQAAQAQVNNMRFVRPLRVRLLPALRFLSSGSPASFPGIAFFSVPVPADIDLSEALRVRLLWAFQLRGPLVDVRFRWLVRNRFFERDAPLPVNLNSEPPAVFEGSLPGSAQRRLLATDPVALPNGLVAQDLQGALQVGVEGFDPVETQVFLISAEIDYVADRLGRGL